MTLYVLRTILKADRYSAKAGEIVFVGRDRKGGLHVRRDRRDALRVSLKRAQDPEFVAKLNRLIPGQRWDGVEVVE